jgi:hypothetical protein
VRARGGESGKVVAGIVATTAFVRRRSDARRALVREPGSNIEGASNVGGSVNPGDVWWLLASIEVSPTPAMEVTQASMRCVLSTLMFSQTCARWPTNGTDINKQFDHERR